jgi:L-ascorbate 6-phosphate lactonase
MKTGNALAEDVRNAKVESGSLAFWWLGQMSFIIKTPTATIALDPFLSPMERRNIPPLATPEELSGLFDVIIGTHDHLDHIDRPMLPRLLEANPKAKLLVPGAIEKLDELGAGEGQLAGMDDAQVWEGCGVKITAIKAAHELFNRNERGYQNLSFVIESCGATALHTGDACVYEGLASTLRRWWRSFNVAFLPINGRDAVRYKRGCIGNMTYQEAADLAGSIEPRLTVPGHFEMFTGNSVDPQLFLDYMAVKYSKLSCRLGIHGERIDC